MSGHSFKNRFWIPVVIIYLLGFVAFGYTLLGVTLERNDSQTFKRFQHDFFTSLSGEKELKYESELAYTIAQIMRNIPAESRDTAFARMRVFSSSSNLNETVEQMIIGNESEIEVIYAYGGLFNSGSQTHSKRFVKIFRDAKMRAAMLEVLEGGAPPTISGTEIRIIPSLTYFFMPWIFGLQFFAFFAYCVSTRLVSGVNAQPIKNYHPLRDLPSGIGSKLSLLITVPGSMPLLVPLLLITATKSAFGSRRQAKNRVYAKGATPSFSGSGTREALAKLERQIRGANG